MQTIEDAVTSFEAAPSDETAQDVNLATMTEGCMAFVGITDGKPVDAALLAALERAKTALSASAAPTALTMQYAKNVALRIDLLRSRQAGDSKRVKALLQGALQEGV